MSTYGVARKIWQLAKKPMKKAKALGIIITNNKIAESNNFGRGCHLRNTAWGKYSGCNHGCTIWDTSIGNYTNIAWNVSIGPRTHIYENFTTHDEFYQPGEGDTDRGKMPFDGFICRIGHDAWIGCNSVILPGVSIGNGAVISAGSVVTKSIPPYAIVGGVPAKILKMRFSDETIGRLEETQWYMKSKGEILLMKETLEGLVGFNMKDYQEKYLRVRTMLT